ncbi:hypothetical protein MKZ38_010475 [Zalerion maritima]|uniref:Uncharacterized protein n=1 Tax=Zalerion maritima TaxID=339359 RepID=A0AAD5RTL9_9PEZI|nr:hypothetical protein MKZ38_010475 [Zalerion maritima]
MHPWLFPITLPFALLALLALLGLVLPPTEAASSTVATISTETVSCMPGSTQPSIGFPNCNAYLEKTGSCEDDHPDLTSSAYASCVCTQPILNNIIECGNELRMCYFQPYDMMEEPLLWWHSVCDFAPSALTFTPTTPPVSSVTSTYEEDFCGTTAEEACGSAISIWHECDAMTQPAEYSSCMCREDMILGQYTCEYLGNITCFATSADVTNLEAYTMCSNAEDVLGGRREGTTITPTLPGDFTESTLPAGSTAGTGSTPTSTSESGSDSDSGASTPARGSVIGGLVLVVLTLNSVLLGFF